MSQLKMLQQLNPKQHQTEIMRIATQMQGRNWSDLILVEEASELIRAATKRIRAAHLNIVLDPKGFIDALADMQIVIETAILSLPYEDKMKISDVRVEKIETLRLGLIDQAKTKEQ